MFDSDSLQLTVDVGALFASAVAEADDEEEASLEMTNGITDPLDLAVMVFVNLSMFK